MKNIAIILAGGTGNRFGTDYPKQFIKLSGRLIIEHTIDKFEKHSLIDEIIVVVHKNYYHLMEELIQKNCYKKVNKLLIGGETRQESSKIGIFTIDDPEAKVIIHDSVRPFVSEQKISEVIFELNNYKSVDVAIPSTDTVVKISDNQEIIDFPIRKQLMRGQTPQGFLLSTIKEAHRLAEINNYSNATDDCSLVFNFNLSKIKVIDDDEFNIKLTYPIDIHIADKIFQIYKHKLSVFDMQTLNNIFNEKIIVIFGGTSGIGEEIKKLCDYFKCKTYVFSRRNGVDIRNYSDIENALRKVYQENQKIDAVICTAGILKIGSIENMNITDIIDQININLISNIFVAKASIKYLKETKGSLIFFASSSYTHGRNGYAPYSASKAGLVNFVQGIADELSAYSINVNIINPERTNTPMRQKAFGKEDPQLLLSSEYVALITLNTIATDITGSVIEVRKIDEVPLNFEKSAKQK
jgi:ribitol-5-phosphate 2-dehydrogenase (NADP+) / D-ribitol-5-phosphate cytidylyltransferase